MNKNLKAHFEMLKIISYKLVIEENKTPKNYEYIESLLKMEEFLQNQIINESKNN